MSQSSTLFIGMEVHKDAIAVAYVAQDHGAEVTSLGPMGTRQGAIDQLIRQRQSKAKPLIFVYEAGPCGAWLSRYLRHKDDDCWGVAPALMPQKAGDRVTTDRRDARQLARLARSGALTAGEVPKVAEAAMRDLTRARDAPRSDRKDAQCRLQAFLRRPAMRYTGRAHWSPAHLRWLSAVSYPTPAQPSVFHEDVRAVHDHTARRQRLAQDLHEHVQAWRWSPGVEAWPALRGVPGTVAVTLVAAMGALTRCDPPRARMQCMGLVPAAYAAGEHRRQGAIPKAGNTHARRVLVEGAWASRSPATVSRHWPLRLATHPTSVQDSRGQAHGRLCKRSRRRVSRGQHAHVVTGAMARELAGFRWAMAREVSITPYTPQRERMQPRTQQVYQRASAETQPRFGVTLGGVKERVRNNITNRDDL